MKTIKIALRIFLLLTLITGVAYPLAITGIAQALLPQKANGSLIHQQNKVIGSSLIGQAMDSSIYFSPRPSAIGYNPLPSGGSNLSLTSAKLIKQVKDRKADFLKKNGTNNPSSIPSEMLFASASGLDPHISPKAAEWQVNRIAKNRNFNSVQKLKLLQLIQEHTEQPQCGILGEARVNVLELNLALDKIKE
ncbi:MAG: potassium-transporting ATPase subunit KdpC [Paludibacteraceae bacterium]|nr:potassium-transporting ATPase subunit KdpC [Paludibacteraceae bacterium]